MALNDLFPWTPRTGDPDSRENFSTLGKWLNLLRTSANAILKSVEARLNRLETRFNFEIKWRVRQYYTSQWDSFPALLAAIGSTPATVYVNSLVTLTADTSIPANVSVRDASGRFVLGNFDLTIFGPFDWGLRLAFDYTGTGVVIFSRMATWFVFPEWWGAIGNGIFDCTFAIQWASDAAGVNGDYGRKTLLFTGATYRCTGTITMPQRYILWKGQKGTNLVHDPATFSNFIEIDTQGEGFVGLETLNIAGSAYQNAKTKYLIHAVGFNELCYIRDVGLRDGIGLIHAESAYLSEIDVRCGPTVWDAVGLGLCTQSEWESVHGVDHAPIHLAQMNACTIRVKAYRVGSVVSGGITPDAVMRIQSSVACSLQAFNTEWLLDPSLQYFTEGSNNYALRAKAAIKMSHVVGDVVGLNVETSHFENLVNLTGSGTVRFGAVNDYQNYCEFNRFVNNSGHDQVIDNYRAYDARGTGLASIVNSGISNEQGWIIRASSLVAGLRYRQTLANSGPNNDLENVVDTFQFSGNEKLGIPDGTSRTIKDRRQIPKVNTGYTVTAGQITSESQYSGSPSGSVGHYVEITPGVMTLESGRVVDLKQGTGNSAVTGLQAVFRLRPVTASRWYRVFVGEAGQPYLVEYSSAQTDPTGNWLAEFATDGSTAITGLTANNRLAIYGVYINDKVMVRSNGRPGASTGHWQVGDVWLHTTPTSSGTKGEVCVTAGTSPTWRAIEDFSGVTQTGDLEFSAASTLIKTTSADGSDDKRIVITPASAAGSTRGASVDIAGNEVASIGGRLRLSAGDVSTGTLSLETGGTARHTIDQSGNHTIPGDIARGTGGPQILYGSGTPEGVKTAPVGSMYQRTDGGAGTSIYIKESGIGNTGWVAK